MKTKIPKNPRPPIPEFVTAEFERFTAYGWKCLKHGIVAFGNTKEEVTVSENDFRYSDGSRPTLRDMVLRATNDGDFQSADVSWGELTIEAIVPCKDGYGQVTRKRGRWKLQTVTHWTFGGIERADCTFRKGE